MHQTALTHRFVEYIPDDLEPGTLYISIPYATVAHSCCCGCGSEVVTPLAPTDWKLTFDGETVSLFPSIGNWSFACQSHYWIEQDRVRWAPRWSREEIAAGRALDAWAKRRRCDRTSNEETSDDDSDEQLSRDARPTIWGALKKLVYWR